jgi:hypothetical protein
MKSLLAAVALAAAAAAPQARPLLLHVPSPDWRDQVIYFVMTDRFDDGDPRNNDQGRASTGPASAAHYNGGDFAGLRRRLDYIRGLGATALWVTPPVANQWFATAAGLRRLPRLLGAALPQVDPHLGTLADYRRCPTRCTAAACPGAGHRGQPRGNYFHYAGGWDAADPARFYTPTPRTRPRRPGSGRSA